MFRPRVIPVLLLKDKGLVKSKRFKDHKYIGDPLNAVKIFNDLQCDELIFLDIMATKEHRVISPEFVKTVGEYTNMPFAAGGGIRTLEQIRALLNSGTEKVIINSYAAEDPGFVLKAAEEFGSSTIVICIDVKKKWWGNICTWTVNGTRPTRYHPLQFARLMEEMGAGEIIIQSIEKDGVMEGYDTGLLQLISEAVNIPVIGLGGAGSIEHMRQALQKTKVNALAAGSFFVYKGINKGVLINYPDATDLNQLKKIPG